MSANQESGECKAKDGISKLQYIDILRGIAILAVLAVHSGSEIQNLFPITQYLFNYGQLGVQLFFVASAITLCLSMSERSEERIANFYVRRFFRIAPLYYCAIIFYFFWRVIKNYAEVGDIFIPLGYGFVGVFENIIFLHGFDPRNSNFVVPGGWSIATEMCFYAIFPLLFIIQAKRGFKGFLIFSVLVMAGSFAAQFFAIEVIQPRLIDRGLILKKYVNDDFSFIYCTILNQISVFLIGMLAFQKLKNYEVTKLALGMAFLLSCMSCYLLNTKEFKTGYNGFFYSIMSAIAFSIFTLKISSASVFVGIMPSFLAKIGQVSFSMYLVHFFILDVIMFVCKKMLFNFVTNPEMQLLFLFPLLVGVTYGVSKLIFSFFEKPAIEYGKRFIRP